MNSHSDLEPIQRQLVNFVSDNIDLNSICGETLVLSPLSGDAGFRQYFRLNTRLPMLAVWAPLETENSVQFCQVSTFFNEHGVRAPRVLAVDLERGFLIVEDFGDALLQTELNERSVDGYYSEAFALLLHLQSAPENNDTKSLFREYDAALLGQELGLFDDWYVQKLLGLRLEDAQVQMLREVYAKLISRATQQRQVIVHRDFHCRNLIVQGNGSLATIDFQDAVRGPITYDLVSLLKDCYVQWDTAQIERWALAYASTAQAAGLIHDTSEREFLQDFDWMGLQRHLKVLGVFARLYLRDGKTGYLADLPRVLSYVLEVCERYDELFELRQFFGEFIAPVAKQKHKELAALVCSA